MTLSTRVAAALLRQRSLRAAIAIAALVILAAACGKKGPPLAPFARVPAVVGNVTAQRIGDDVFVSFPVPTTNVDGQQPVDIGSLEVYAITATKPPETDEHRKLATLVATLPVRPLLPAGIAPDGPAIDADGKPRAADVPAIPAPPGIDRAVPAVVRESLSPDKRVPLELPVKTATPVAPIDEEVIDRPLIAPTASELPRRYYFVIGVSSRGRKAPASAPVAVPLDAASSAPAAPQVTFTETAMTVTWAPSADARAAAFAAPPAPAPPPAAGNVSPGTVTPPVPVTPLLPPLPAKSLGFQSEATTYHLFEVPTVAAPEDPFALAVPTPLTPQPMAVTEHVIKGVTFGAERCFIVRPVEQMAGAVVMGPASPRTCVTPADTFPPAAPKSLAAIAGEGVISLIWEPNTESDLAGYLVLRGDAPGDTLRAITPEPVLATTYRDSTARAGTRYVYVVVAVDRATPQNVSAQSNRVEETAR